MVNFLCHSWHLRGKTSYISLFVPLGSSEIRTLLSSHVCKGKSDYTSAKQPPRQRNAHRWTSVSSASLLFQYNHITTLPTDLRVLTIVHSYLFQLQVVFSLVSKSSLQDGLQVDTQRKAAEQWACFPTSSFCYDFRCEIHWQGGDWTDMLNCLVHWFENLLS